MKFIFPTLLFLLLSGCGFISGMTGTQKTPLSSIGAPTGSYKDIEFVSAAAENVVTPKSYKASIAVGHFSPATSSTTSRGYQAELSVDPPN